MIKEDMLASKLNWEETWNELIFSLHNSKPLHVMHAPSIFAFSNDQMFFPNIRATEFWLIYLVNPIGMLQTFKRKPRQPAVFLQTNNK